jgi:hypothetical protein
LKHFPARHVPAQIGAHLADEITRASRRQFWVSIGQSIACGLIGLLFGLMFGLGYLADLPPWLR